MPNVLNDGIWFIDPSSGEVQHASHKTVRLCGMALVSVRPVEEGEERSAFNLSPRSMCAPAVAGALPAPRRRWGRRGAKAPPGALKRAIYSKNFLRDKGSISDKESISGKGSKSDKESISYIISPKNRACA